MGLFSALASIGGSIISGIFGNSQVRKTNDTQLQIARETNEFNASEAQKNRDFQKSMYWNSLVDSQNATREERQYNSPIEQQKRMLEAGINPALTSSSGVAQSAPSVVPSPTSGAQATGVMPNILPYPNIVGDSIDAFGKLADATSKFIKNKRDKIELKREQMFDKILSNASVFVDPDTNVPIEDLETWQENNPDKTPILEKYGFKNEGGLRAMNAINDYLHKKSSIFTDLQKNKLIELVSKNQLADKDTIEALSQIPKKEFEQLVQKTKQIINDNNLFDLKKQEFEFKNAILKLQEEITSYRFGDEKRRNVFTYLDKIFDGDKEFTMKDFLQCWLLMMISNRDVIAGALK